VKKVELDFNNGTEKNVKMDMPKVIKLENSDRSVMALTAATNTSPNNAQLVTQFAAPIGGNIGAAGEQRWYVLPTSEKMKLSWNLLTDTTVDCDLYMYKLDEATMTLKFVTGTANHSVTREYITNIQESGIYYIVVHGYNGTGNFNLTPYGSAQDMDMEVNDTTDAAFHVNYQAMNISGVIDNPNDRDCYEITVYKQTILDIDLTSPAGTNYIMYYSDGEGVFSYNMDNFLVLEAGTYSFIVLSADNSYHNVNPYTLNAKLVTGGGMSLLRYTDDLKTFFTKNENNEYFVNGNLIEFKYDFEHHVSNSGGTANTYMHLYPNENLEVGADWFGFIDYTTDWFGAESRNRVLVVTMLNSKYEEDSRMIAVVDRYTSGAYIDPDERSHYKLPYCQMIIDPETGKVIDLLEPNFYYEQGNQSFKYIQSYTNK